jgi:hypothetical protein
VTGLLSETPLTGRPDVVLLQVHDDQSKGPGTQQTIGNSGTATPIACPDDRQGIQVDATGGQVRGIEEGLRGADPGYRLALLLRLAEQGAGKCKAPATGELHETTRQSLQRPALRQRLFEMGRTYQIGKSVSHGCTLPYSP